MPVVTAQQRGSANLRNRVNSRERRERERSRRREKSAVLQVREQREVGTREWERSQRKSVQRNAACARSREM